MKLVAKPVAKPILVPQYRIYIFIINSWSYVIVSLRFGRWRRVTWFVKLVVP